MWQTFLNKLNHCFRNMHLNQARSTRRGSSSSSWPTWSRRMGGTETWPGPAQPIVTSTTCVVQPLGHVTVGKWAGTGHQGHYEVQAGGTILYWTAFWEGISSLTWILFLESIKVRSVLSEVTNTNECTRNSQTKYHDMNCWCGCELWSLLAHQESGIFMFL